MAIEVLQNEEISGGGKNGREKKSQFCHPLERSEWGAYTLRNDSEEELFIEMLIPTQSEKRSSEEREEVESSEKDKLCLTKMITPLLACVASGERMPDWEWVRSENRAENPGIRKEEDELRLDFWIIFFFVNVISRLPC